MTDSPGQPELTEARDQRTAPDAQQTENTDQRTAPDTQQTGDAAIGTAPDAQQTGGTAIGTPPDARQTVSLNTQQAAQQLGVDSRTVRRYISDGIRTAGGAMLRLEARQVRTQRGPEWQIYQEDLDAFKQERDRAATEGQAATGLVTRAEESQALTTSVQIIAAELERRSQALAEAQQTIERLAHEAGRQAGRNEELERERDVLQRRIMELEGDRDQWRQKAQTPRRIRLLPWRKEAEP